ncbi:copper transporter [Tepidanaerobacter syntrophicus]|uniref:Copper transport outer membrane protein, MctB n=1 Tax=Tepidanaerobacter syntrophicus TaxID=224999 RepID=A0A0U9HKU9_9FIRM|nr:copper transporter [Tepidanaerobacter syntrophicus]GAQ24433.1 copper transport outer membrane protein, MctB [Tepidanaerobacter syntrophicus]
MLINIKYLVITVISIFLALGIGILVGVQMDSEEIIVEQQEITLQKMEEKFSELNQTNEELKNQIQKLSDANQLSETYIKNIFPDYIKGKLAGMHVVVVETSGDYVYTEMRQALKTAGADVVSISFDNDKLFNMTEEDESELMAYFKLASKENIIPAIVKNVSDAAYGKANKENLAFLIEKGILYVSGNLETPANYVVIAGGSSRDEGDNRYEAIDIPLIRELKKYSLPVIGVETTDAKISYIEMYKKQNISTVDNVDTVIGQTSLILVMTGKEGHYGVKNSANSLMPFLSEEEKTQ